MAVAKIVTSKKVIEIHGGIYELREHTVNEFGNKISRTLRTLNRNQENSVICQLGIDARLDKLQEYFPEADSISFDVAANLDF